MSIPRWVKYYTYDYTHIVSSSLLSQQKLASRKREDELKEKNSLLKRRWRQKEKNLSNENVFPLSFILLFTHTQKDSSRNCKQFFHMSQGNKYLWEMDIINLPSESAHFARYWLLALLIYRSLLPTRVKVSSEVFLSVLQMPIKSTLWTGIKYKKIISISFPVILFWKE